MSDGKRSPNSPQPQKRDWYDKTSLVVLVFTFLAALAAAVFAARLAWIAKDTEERQLRAYLYVEHGSFGPVSAGTPIGPIISIRAAGVTPAYKLHLAATIEIGEFPLPDASKLSDPFDRGGEGVTRASYPILYGNDGSISEPIRVKFSQRATDLLKVDHHRLYVFGAVKYLDIFSMERRYDFCFSFNADPDSPIKSAGEDGCDKYNKPG